jgi:zinc D-Ala-D-Ala carboxypeptidase
MMRLSKNFTLEEFLRSEYAERNDIDMTPPPEIIENIRLFVKSCMQPLRDEVGVPINITSGYRPLALNVGIGGSKTSAHVRGEAADCTVVGQTPYETAQLIEHMDLPYDQVIHEFGKWVHLGVGDTLRGQELTAHRHEGKTRYVLGILTLEEAGEL